MSGRVKGKPRASQADMAQKALEDYQEVQRRQGAQAQQSTREQLERAARRQGWTIRDA